MINDKELNISSLKIIQSAWNLIKYNDKCTIYNEFKIYVKKVKIKMKCIQSKEL